MKILAKSIPLWALLIIVSFLSVSFVMYLQFNKAQKDAQEKIQNPNNKVKFFRSAKGHFTKPLLMADNTVESDQLSELKHAIETEIFNSTTGGGIKNASAYYRDLSSGYWISINNNEQYSVASIMKILTMIYHLKKDDEKSGWLNQNMKIERNLTGDNIQTTTDKHSKIGNTYTIRELLEYMIYYSDNNATAHLNSLMDYNQYTDLMRDLDIPVPLINQTDYRLTCEQTSRFLRVLYNCSFLSIKNSEYALELLTESSFHGGLLRDIKSDVKIAHKFGERFLPDQNELHETAIFYIDNNPFLLTVMTNGKDTAQEAYLLGKIGSIAFDYASKLKNQ